MFVFANHASSIMKIEKDDDEMADITNVAKKIKDEIKVIPFDKSKYRTSIDLNVALGEASPALLTLLSEISSSLSNSLPAALIGNMVTSSFCRKYTSLQLSLGILLREKKLIEHFYCYNVCCSYDEVRRFKLSAAVACKDSQTMGVLSDHKNGLVQVIADNFDANISSQNGLKQTHWQCYFHKQNIYKMVLPKT